MQQVQPSRWGTKVQASSIGSTMFLLNADADVQALRASLCYPEIFTM